MKEFTNDWFGTTAQENFEKLLLPSNNVIRHALEIGSYEGRSTCWLLEHMNLDRIVCVDTWKGGEDHVGIDMQGVRERFHDNTKDAINAGIVIPKVGKSADVLRTMTECEFDFIYIDGGHTAKDVLQDAVLAWPLLRQGGAMAFDDYNWVEKPRKESNPLNNPRLAIDAFYMIYRRECVILPSTLSQFWIMKF